MMRTLKNIFIIISFIFVTTTVAQETPATPSKPITQPWMVILTAGIGTIYSGILYQAAADQEVESEKNIKHIDKIITSFKDSYTIMCPNGRDDLKQPKCYCYSSDGKKNEGRSNSQTCQELWAKDDYKLSGDADNYGLAKLNTDPAGCVNVKGEFDENCQCKKLVNSQGQNACKKISSVTFNDQSEANLANATDLSKIVEYANTALGGTPNLNILGESALKANAIKTKQIADQFKSKMPAEDKKMIPTLNSDNVAQAARAILGKSGYENAIASSGNFSNSLGPASSDRANQILAEAKEKAGIATEGTGKGLANKKAKDKKVALDFGDISSGGAGEVIGGFESPNYKYKNSDIVTNEDTSIFEIINNRYVQSGLKRLFDDESTEN